MGRAALASMLLAGAIALAGCSEALEGAADVLAGTRPLHTAPSPKPGEQPACMAALALGTLSGDPADPALAWLVQLDGTRQDVVWPWAFRVRFTPGAEVLTPQGDVIAREGEELILGGGEVGGGAFLACTVNGWDPFTERPSDVESP